MINRITKVCMLMMLCICGIQPTNVYASKQDIKISKSYLKTVRDTHVWIQTQLHIDTSDKAENRADESVPSLMRKSLVYVSDHMTEILPQLTHLLKKEYEDMLKLVSLYIYSALHPHHALCYYDVESIVLLPVNQDNLWVAIFPYTKSNKNTQFDYTSLVLDLKHGRAM